MLKIIGLNKLLLLFLFMSSKSLLSIAHAEDLSSHQPRSIQVSGTGKSSVAPDKADISLSVEVQAKTAESARNQAASIMDVVIKELKDKGVADKDIQTRSLSLYPNYSPTIANRIIGYQLANQVAVSVHKIKRVSEIVDSAVKAGGDAVRVQGISFSVENPETAMAQARDKAFANATQKAEQYAKLAGLSLGSPLHIRESTAATPLPAPYGEMRMMKAEMIDNASTPLHAGEQEVTVTVDVMFGIQ